MKIIVKNFQDLSVSELYQVLHLREKVFIVEQSCPYQDLDYTDQEAIHILVYQKNNLVAYTRIFRHGVKYKEASIGRVVTDPSFRSHGYGKIVMQASIQELGKMGENVIVLSSQAYAEKFYRKLGFQRTTKAPYLEDDIPHVEMVYRGEDTNE